MSGYYLVSRTLNDPLHDLHPHSRGEPSCAAFAWIDLIGLARWKDSGGCPRGSCDVSERFLATRWNWHRSRVRRFLSDLESENRISRDPQTGRKQARITICNYDTYQDPRPTDAQESDPRVGPRVGPNRKKKEERNTIGGSSERKSRLPKDWSPTASHIERAQSSGIDLMREIEKFRAHATENGRTAERWNAAFTRWLINAEEYAKRDGRLTNGRGGPKRRSLKGVK